MRLDGQFREHGRGASLNIAPVIDVVFLLIIFFVLACRFIEPADCPVAVPDGCEFAQDSPEDKATGVTVTVVRRGDAATFAAAGQRLSLADGAPATMDRLAALLDEHLAESRAGRKLVTLRIDKDVPFAQAQYALAAVARSCATDVRLAVLGGTARPDRRLTKE